MPRVNMKSFWAHEIPLPPLEDQIRIAHLLSKVEGVIAQRKQHLQKLDDLLKSVFLNMFGITDGTYKEWPTSLLENQASVSSGVTKGKKYGNQQMVEVPYLRVANVQDTLYLDYFANDATRLAFRDNFDFEVNGSPIALFQAFQVLLSLNLYTVSGEFKADLYKSDSHYVSETVPTLASDQRIMRFKFAVFDFRYHARSST